MGFGLSQVHATMMAAKMAAPGDTMGDVMDDESAVHDCCDGLGGADESAAANCLPLCAAPAVALLPSLLFAVESRGSDCVCRAQVFPPGRALAPDLRPPRSDRFA